MLKHRKLIEICIYPRIYNVLSFYSKGSYSIGISLIEQSIEGYFIRSFKPFICNIKKRQQRSSKKASERIVPETNIHQFITEHFYVTYNQESVYFNSSALFKFEVDQNFEQNHKKSQNGSKKTKIYINLNLYLNKNKTIRVTQTDITQSQNKGIKGSKTESIKTIKKIIKVDSRQLYLNMNGLQDIDCYKRILFSDCQYFSILDLYIGSIYLGSKMRIHQYGLTQFYEMEETAKINKHLESIKLKEQNCSKINSNYFIKKLFGNKLQNPSSDLLDYRRKYQNMLQSSLSSLKIRIKNLEKLSETILNDQSLKIQENYPWLHSCVQIDFHLNNLTNLNQLQNYYNTNDIEQLYVQVYQEICQFDQYVRGIWQYYLAAIQNLKISPFSVLISRYLQKQNQIKKNNAIVHQEIEENLRKSHHNSFLVRRKQLLNNLQIYEEDDIYHPFIMIQGYDYQRQKQNQVSEQISSLDITSLVIFVHGYQGSDYDLEKAKNYMTLYDPKSYGLLIKSIQDQIDQNLQYLGQKVAQQIRNHLRTTTNSYKTINFVGYSLGGVIIRESLRHLEDYKSKMNLLITFASPHLGVIQSDNALVGTGIWYLININKVKNLMQLNCQTLVQQIQAQSPRDVERMSAAQQQQKYSSLLEKLSNSKCLSWFQKVVVVSSKQDNFVPYHSSRIDADPQMYTRDQRIIQMSRNILKRVKKIERVEVWFDVQHDINTFDKVTGRRAHIQFLENRVFLDLFFRMYGCQL